jgi:3-deoxy-D-manno-octulosonate 8-phosphate phosphatase (KDO 8-P phosphatase)
MDERFAKIKLLILDVDGVLTDGQIFLNHKGEEIKAFNVRDGLGLKMLMAGGVDVAIITGRRSGAVEHRGRELGITDVYQGVGKKREICRKLIRKKMLAMEEVCCIADDLPELPMFHEVGLAVAVADAVQEVRDSADLVTTKKGGHGAVRELCEWILKGLGKWPRNDFTEQFHG